MVAYRQTFSIQKRFCYGLAIYLSYIDWCALQEALYKCIDTIHKQH